MAYVEHETTPGRGRNGRRGANGRKKRGQVMVDPSDLKPRWRFVKSFIVGVVCACIVYGTVVWFGYQWAMSYIESL